MKLIDKILGKLKKTEEVQTKEVQVKKAKPKKEKKEPVSKPVKYKKKQVEIRANSAEMFESKHDKVVVAEQAPAVDSVAESRPPKQKRKNKTFVKREEQVETNLFGVEVSDLKMGDIVKCEVLREESDRFYVEMKGYYLEAILLKNEIDVMPAVGDEVEGIVYRFYSEEYYVSNRRIESHLAIKNIGDLKGSLETVSATVIGFEHNNFTAKIDNKIDALIYVRNIDLAYVSDPELYIGKTFDFTVRRVLNSKKYKFELSRVELLREQQAQLVSNLNEGDVLTVNQLTANKGGLEFTHSGIRGFIPISEISHDFIANFDEYVQSIDLNEERQVKVTEIRKTNRGIQITASIKALTPSNWEVFINENQVEDVVDVKIDAIRNYGLIVKTAENIRGLLHISELTNELSAMYKELKQGQVINVKITAINEEEQKVSFTAILN